jgi:outer membrane protein assembly factor BamB
MRLKLGVHGTALASIVQDKLYVANMQDFSVSKLSTGEQLWHASIEQEQRFSVPAQIVNGVVYITSSSVKFQNGHVISNYLSHVYAFDSETGRLLWQSARQNGAVIDLPIVYNGTVYNGTEEHFIYAVHADTGKEWWHQEEDGRIAYSIQEENGVFYAQIGDGFMGDKDRTLIAFKPDGTIIWQKTLVDFLGSRGMLTFVVQNGVIYACGVKQLNAYSTTDGRLLWVGLANSDQLGIASLAVVP